MANEKNSSAVSRLFLGIPVLVRKIRVADFTNSWGSGGAVSPPAGAGQSPFLVVSLGAQTGIPVSKTLWIRP